MNENPVYCTNCGVLAAPGPSDPAPCSALGDPFDMTYAEIENAYMELRKERAQIAEYLWPNQTGLPNEHRNILVAVQTREKLLKAQHEGALIREKGLRDLITKIDDSHAFADDIQVRRILLQCCSKLGLTNLAPVDECRTLDVAEVLESALNAKTEARP